MKLSQDAEIELPLNDERLPEPRKLNRHVAIALRHMNIQLESLNGKIEALSRQRDDLQASIKALSPE
jgi:hypothetical protein